MLAKNAKSAILLEESTGEILYEFNSHEKLEPASMTKMMSLLLIMEAIEKDVIKWDQMITVSSNASGMGGSQILLEIGEKMSVDDLVKGIAIASGNDAVVALAEAIAAAKDGGTVILLKDITVSDSDIQTVGNYKVMFNVEGKNITLDMNGKQITVNYTGDQQYLVAVFRVADGAGLTVTGNGAIDVPTNGISVAYMFWKAGTTGYLTIENGPYHMDNSGDSMVYTNGSEIVTINGGTFTIDNIDFIIYSSLQ